MRPVSQLLRLIVSSSRGTWRTFLLCSVLWFVVACSGSGDARAPGAEREEPGAFSIPTIVAQLSPYASAEAALADQNNIDWRRDAARAEAITLAYAARELQRHLALVGVDAAIESSARPGRFAIVLAVIRAGQSTPDAQLIHDESLGEQGYAIIPWDNQVWIGAQTRIGVLNGVYRLLDHLGFAWYDPWETHTPERLPAFDRIAWPTLREAPRVERRGFWIYGEQKLPAEFAIWMARNRFNIGGTAPEALGAVLGLQVWRGEHDLLQQEFSRAGLFEAHPEWFALIAGQRWPIPPSGPYFNPAFGNTEAANYFAQRMLERLEGGDLQDVDVLNVWPADDRGNAFDQSAEARALGNETDNLLHFYAVLCRTLREAHSAGRLSRPVTVAGISYFITMRPPTNAAVVADLAAEDYLHLFYLIQRSWSGPLEANLANREVNRQILADLTAWSAFADLSYGVVEYHNLSSYGAVAVSNVPFLSADYETVTARQGDLFAYMHPLLVNPGPRRLTNAVLGKLAWRSAAAGDAAQRADEVIEDYFTRRYGSEATEWRDIYELMSQSVENAKEMFGMDSLFWVLFQEQIWTPTPYTRAEANAFIQPFRSGGLQELPGGYSSRVSFRETFRGLDESLALQRQAATRWPAIIARAPNSAVRARMEADVAWFLATSSRYRLTAATCDYILAVEGSEEQVAARARMEDEIAFLETSAVTHDTISPVDQGDFLNYHRRLLEMF